MKFNSTLFATKRMTHPAVFSEKPRLRYLDVAFSSSCNFTCATCYSENSSKWIQFDRATQKKFPFRRHARSEENLLRSRMSEKLFRETTALIPHLEKIDIKGGEPLIEKYCLEFLQECAAQGSAANISLTTNMSVLTERTLELLETLPDINFAASVDATGDLFRFIRGGRTAGFQEIERNIHRILAKGIPVCISPTISVYNLWNIEKILDWIAGLGEKYGASAVYVRYSVVIYPSYASPGILPMELRTSAVRQLRRVQKKYPLAKYDSKTLGGVIRFLEGENPYGLSPDALETEQQNCRDWAAYMSGLRGMDIRRLVLELSEFLAQ